DDTKEDKLDEDLEVASIEGIRKIRLQALSREELVEQTKRDPVMKEFKKFLAGEKSRLSYQPGVNTFEQLRDQITWCEKSQLFFKGHKVIVPPRLEAKVLALAHEGHVGSDRLKANIRQFLVS